MCFFVRGDSIVEKEFVFCYCLFAVSIFGDSTAFGHHISLNPGSVYTPAVYYVKNMSVVVVLSKTNVFFFGSLLPITFISITFHHVRGVNSHDLGNGIKIAAFDLPFRSISVSETIKFDGMKDQLYFRLVEQSILNMQVTSFGLRFSQLSVEQTTLKL